MQVNTFGFSNFGEMFTYENSNKLSFTWFFRIYELLNFLCFFAVAKERSIFLNSHWVEVADFFAFWSLKSDTTLRRQKFLRQRIFFRTCTRYRPVLSQVKKPIILLIKQSVGVPLEETSILLFVEPQAYKCKRSHGKIIIKKATHYIV